MAGAEAGSSARRVFRTGEVEVEGQLLLVGTTYSAAVNEDFSSWRCDLGSASCRSALFTKGGDCVKNQQVERSPGRGHGTDVTGSCNPLSHS